MLVGYMRVSSDGDRQVVAALREAEDVPDQLLAHLSPLGWEHVNLTGDYVWAAPDEASDTCDGFRPLRPVTNTMHRVPEFALRPVMLHSRAFR